METMNEIIPFAKEILSQRPSRGMMKVYLLGSTLACLEWSVGWWKRSACHFVNRNH
uniref:Lymphocyte G0/G1 switch protein 2 n=1 Tax=Salmo salar TaxID=8030 RepID=B5XAF7_SALSA|nr:lymphocyte G0/G1 switch protein 2 [Salmo salar]